MNYQEQYFRWKKNVKDIELLEELNAMSEKEKEDAFLHPL